MKDALAVCTVSIKAKDESGVKVLEEIFKKFGEPFIKKLKFFKNIQKITKFILEQMEIKYQLFYLLLKVNFFNLF